MENLSATAANGNPARALVTTDSTKPGRCGLPQIHDTRAMSALGKASATCSSPSRLLSA